MFDLNDICSCCIGFYHDHHLVMRGFINESCYSERYLNAYTLDFLKFCTLFSSNREPAFLCPWHFRWGYCFGSLSMICLYILKLVLA